MTDTQAPDATVEAEPICLTPLEVEGLRELLAFLAVLEDRGFGHEERLVEVSLETWRSMTTGPKRKLSRLTRYLALKP